MVSGTLTLSGDLGLITGAAAVGAVSAFGAATSGLVTASPGAVTAGLRLTFAVATVLIIVALSPAHRDEA